MNPNLRDVPIYVRRNNTTGFIGYGDSHMGGILTTKTHPRWCPIEYLDRM